MRYLLVVGFACDVYRREPRARIFVGNHLVDEFDIQHTSDNLFTGLKSLTPLMPVENAQIFAAKIKNFPPLKFYEIQVNKIISDLAIRITIDNHDSNYSNGYLTRSTLIKLKICAFFPLNLRLLERLKTIQDENHIRAHYAWYKSRKNFVFDLAVNGMYWKDTYNKKFSNTSDILNSSDKGGDGEYVCQLTKKYGMLMPTLARACRHSSIYSITNYLLDKYCQHENQRNNN